MSISCLSLSLSLPLSLSVSYMLVQYTSLPTITIQYNLSIYRHSISRATYKRACNNSDISLFQRLGYSVRLGGSCHKHQSFDLCCIAFIFPLILISLVLLFPVFIFKTCLTVSLECNLLNKFMLAVFTLT